VLLVLEAGDEVTLVVLALFSIGLILWVEFEGLSWSDPRFQVAAAIDLLVVILFAAELGAWLSARRTVAATSRSGGSSWLG
jgi:hypothetical protein